MLTIQSADSTAGGGVGGGGGTPGPRAQYRDYLKNLFFDVAHKSDASTLPPHGKASDADYLALLIGLTKVNTNELLNRYRIRFDRFTGELSSPVDLNIEALQVLLTDSFESPVDSVGVVDVPNESQLQPIVPPGGACRVRGVFRGATAQPVHVWRHTILAISV